MKYFTPQLYQQFNSFDESLMPTGTQLAGLNRQAAGGRVVAVEGRKVADQVIAIVEYS